MFNLFNDLLLRDNLFRIRQSGSQSERPKVVVSYDDCGVGGDADYVDGDDMPIMLMIVNLFVAMMVVISIMIENNVEFGKDDHVILVDTLAIINPGHI